MLTTSRIITLMRESWPELEELVVVGIKGSDFGPKSESMDMWDEDAEENLMEDNFKAMYGASVNQSDLWPKPKGLNTFKVLDPGASWSPFQHVQLSLTTVSLLHRCVRR